MRKYLHNNNNVPENERTHAVPEAKQLGLDAVGAFDMERNKGKNLQDVENGDILEKEVNAINQYNSKIPHGQHPELWGNAEHNTIMTQFLHASGDAADEIVSTKTPEGVDKDEYHDSFAPLEVTSTEHQVAFREGALSENTSVTQSPSSSILVEASSVNDAQNSSEDDTMYPVGVIPKGTISAPTVISATTGGDTFSSINDPVPSSISLNKEIPSSSHKRKREDDETDNEQGPSTRRVTEDMVEETISSIYDLAGDD